MPFTAKSRPRRVLPVFLGLAASLAADATTVARGASAEPPAIAGMKVRAY